MAPPQSLPIPIFRRMLGRNCGKVRDMGIFPLFCVSPCSQGARAGLPPEKSTCRNRSGRGSHSATLEVCGVVWWGFWAYPVVMELFLVSWSFLLCEHPNRSAPEKQGETTVEGAKPYPKSRTFPFVSPSWRNRDGDFSDVLMLLSDANCSAKRIRDSLAIARFFRFWMQYQQKLHKPDPG
jgi:hypothetical protein